MEWKGRKFRKWDAETKLRIVKRHLDETHQHKGVSKTGRNDKQHDLLMGTSVSRKRCGWIKT